MERLILEDRARSFLKASSQRVAGADKHSGGGTGGNLAGSGTLRFIAMGECGLTH